MPPAATGATNMVDTNERRKKSKKKPLVEDLGGPSVFRSVVDEFYARVVNDPELSPFFVGVNVHKIKWHSFNIISTAFSSSSSSGPAEAEEYGNDTDDVLSLISSKHESLFSRGLSVRHFNLFLRHFESTMEDLGVEEGVRERATATVRPYRAVFEEGEKAAAAATTAAGVEKEKESKDAAKEDDNGEGLTADEQRRIGEAAPSGSRWIDSLSRFSRFLWHMRVGVGLGVLGLISYAVVRRKRGS